MSSRYRNRPTSQSQPCGPSSSSSSSLSYSSSSSRSLSSGAAIGGPRRVPVELYLECQSEQPPVRHSAQQTGDGRQWQEEKKQPRFVPRALPAVEVSEAASQVDSGAVFDWDDAGSLDPLLHSLVSKTLAQSTVEVEQEERWKSTRSSVADYNGRLAADAQRVLQMEREEAERQQRQQADVQAARIGRFKQQQLISKQLAAVVDSRALADQLQSRVKDSVEEAYQQQERVSVQALLQKEILSGATPMYADRSKARAVVDSYLRT